MAKVKKNKGRLYTQVPRSCNERGEKFCAVNLQCQRLWYTRGVRVWLVVIATMVLAMTDER